MTTDITRPYLMRVDMQDLCNLREALDTHMNKTHGYDSRKPFLELYSRIEHLIWKRELEIADAV